LVHRYDDKEFLALIEKYNIHFIPASKEDRSLGTSISIAMQKISNLNCFDTCSIFLADMPYISKSSIQTLLKVSSQSQIIRPSYKTKQGHPVIFGKDFFLDLTQVDGRGGAKSVITKNIFALHIVEVEDKGTVIDIDFPQDIYKKG